MICEKCGSPLNEGDVFCGTCGNKVEPIKENSKSDEKSVEKETVFNPYEFNTEQGSENVVDNDKTPEIVSETISEAGEPENSDINFVPSTSPNSKIKTVKLNKKVLIITIPILVILCVGLIAGYSIWNSVPVEIHLSDYIYSNVYTDADREAFYSANGYEDYDLGDDYENGYYVNDEIGIGLNVYGYNEFASVSEYELYNIVDWEALENDVNKQLRKKKKVSGRHLTFYDFVNEETFSFTADKVENIKNDDIVSVTVDNHSSSFSGITVKFIGYSSEYTITDLVTVQAFDPFDYVVLSLYGANGYASAECVVDNELNQDIEGLDGFKVIYYDDNTVAIEKDDYIVAKIDFYLSDDSEYDTHISNGDTVTMLCSCSENLTELYNIYISSYHKDYSISGLGEYVIKSNTISADDINKFKSNAIDEINSRYGESDSYSGFSFVSAYIADPKDKTTSSSYHNSLCLIYSYSYSYWSDEVETRYMCVNYENLILSPDGTIAFNPESYFDGLSSSYYDSVDDVLSSKFSDKQNVSKIA